MISRELLLDSLRLPLDATQQDIDREIRRWLGNDEEANGREVDRRLAAALDRAGRSALGMPAAVDTFKAWLSEAGLCLVVLRPEGRADG